MGLLDELDLLVFYLKSCGPFCLRLFAGQVLSVSYISLIQKLRNRLMYLSAWHFRFAAHVIVCLMAGVWGAGAPFLGYSSLSCQTF